MLSMICFFCLGAPQPIVNWERVGAPLPRSAEIYGNTLIISAVDASDGGTYRCVASNAAGTVYAQVVLLIEGG